MSFTGTGGVKTLAVRAVHLWGRLMTLLRGNPNKIEENKYQVDCVGDEGKGEEGARERDGAGVGIPQAQNCFNFPMEEQVSIGKLCRFSPVV